MPLFLAALLGGLVQLAASLVGRVLIALAVGYVSYEGIDSGLTSVTSSIWSHFTSLDSSSSNVCYFVSLTFDADCVNCNQLGVCVYRVVRASGRPGCHLLPARVADVLNTEAVHYKEKSKSV